MTYEELYGVNLEEYCKYHDTEPNGLVLKTQRDIELLKKNLHRHIYDIEPTNWELVSEIHKLLNKKEEHLKRLKKWTKEKKQG